MAKNLIFGLLDHSKMDICDIWMILHDLVTLPKVGKHLVLSQSAISSRSNRPNSRKWPKTSFLALWIIQKCIFLIFEWSSMSHIMAKLLRPFSIVKICNIKLIRWTKLEKMANIQIDPQAPLLVVPFLIRFTPGETQNLCSAPWPAYYLLDIMDPFPTMH